MQVAADGGLLLDLAQRCLPLREVASANKRGLGKGRDKVRECWGVGIGRTAGRSSIGELEQKLRDDLTGVDLVCEADPAPGELQMAEEVCRAAFASGDYDGLATRRPAILVSYVAIRGAEWCEGIRVWPQLGVTEYSSRAGQAFLTALRRLGLPDFQQMVRQERARRYVAPILIHGGIPADRLHLLLDRLELELDRGLTGGAEAVDRLDQEPEGLGKPVTRLVRYAPEFAAEFLDALIDQITGESSPDRTRKIPRHLEAALEERRGSSPRSRRRVHPPTVEFDPWTGYGPEIRCPDAGREWTIHFDGGRSIVLRPGQSVEAEPVDRLTAQSEGRLYTLWEHPVLWFDETDRLLPPGAELPRVATVVKPHGWSLVTNAESPPVVIDEGQALSGVWSGHQSVTVDLAGVESVTAVPSTGAAVRPSTRRVSQQSEPRLVGAAVRGVTTTTGGAVFAEAPALELAQVDGPIPVTFTAHGERSRSWLHEPEVSTTGTISVSDLLGDGPLAGCLELRDAEGRRHPFDLAVVPGLSIEGLDTPLGPQASTTAVLRADTHVLTGGVKRVDVPPLVDHVDVDIAVPGGLRIQAPRVRWGLRSGGPFRLDLASGVIDAGIDELTGDDVRLVVRCGREATVELALHVDGRRQQTGEQVRTRAGGRQHQCILPLARYADTLRWHRDAAIELRLLVDGVSMVAVRSGRRDAPAPTARTWSSARQEAPSARADDTWSSVEWLRESDRRRSALVELDDDLARSLADPVYTRLRRLTSVEQVVIFIDELGQASRQWAREGAPPTIGREAVSRWGRGGPQWAAFEAVADELWRLQGVRYREFAGKRNDEGLMHWSRRARTELRRLPRARSTDVELWTFGRIPPIDRLSDWRCVDWIVPCMPHRRGASGTALLPAALAYQVLALAGGEVEAGDAVAQAAKLVPTTLLELVAWLLEVARKGTSFEPPVLAPLPDPDDAEHEEPDADSDPGRTAADGGDRPVVRSSGASLPPRPQVLRQPRVPPVLRSLEQCDVAVHGREVRIRPPAPVCPPVVRVLSPEPGSRALAGLIPTPDGDELVAQLPADLDGTLVLAPADPRSVPLRFGSQGSEIYIPATRRPAATSVVARGHDLRQIERLRRQSLVERVAHATDTSELALAAIEELFEDEAGATEALADYAETCRDGHRLDRLGLAVLPTATIFSRLPIGASAEARLRSTAPILWAALAPRTATRWRLVRWPHPDSFGRGRWAFDDIVAFGQRQFAACDDGFNGLTTIRYVVGAGDSGRSRLRQTIQRLDRLTDPRFVDLVVTTYSAITVDAVMPEATRLLLDAHHLRPTSTTCAVLVGTALAFAAAED